MALHLCSFPDFCSCRVRRLARTTFAIGREYCACHAQCRTARHGGHLNLHSMTLCLPSQSFDEQQACDSRFHFMAHDQSGTCMNSWVLAFDARMRSDAGLKMPRRPTCSYYHTHKRRSCKQQCREGSPYCGIHQPASSSSERVVCPVDPSQWVTINLLLAVYAVMLATSIAS